MKVKIWAPIAVLAVAILLTSWSRGLLGDDSDLEHPDKLVGCYSYGPNKLVITIKDASVVATHQSTSIKRFFVLKYDIAMETVNDLTLDASGHGLRVGSGNTGYSYRFNDDAKSSALLVPDDGGIVRTLSRTSC